MLTKDKELSFVVQKSIEDYARETFPRYLPDMTDGLKEVNRRIIWVMYLNNIVNFTKCSFVFGNVNKYHPHGDKSIYDAMVYMAQTWKLSNYPLITWQGNKGSLNGDPPAQLRYTQCKLSDFAVDAIISLIDKHSIDYVVSSANDKLIEPVYLPSRVPIILINGGFGIAQAFSSSIPPHKLGDICNITKKYINNKDIPLKHLVKGLYPEFTTGCKLMNSNKINEFYTVENALNSETGDCLTGKMELKCKINITNNSTIEIDDLSPFGDSFMGIKYKIIQKIKSGTNPLFNSIIDMNDMNENLLDHQFKTIITCKKKSDSDLIPLLNALEPFFTSSRPISLIVNNKCKPVVVNIKDIIEHWYEVQRLVRIKKITRKITDYSNRLHIQQGLSKAYDVMDHVVNICKNGKNKDDIVRKLVNKYDFTLIQAENISNMNLYKLSKISKENINNECRRLIDGIQIENAKKEKIDSILISDIDNIKSKYDRERRTQLVFSYEMDDFKINSGYLMSTYNSINIITDSTLLEKKNFLDGVTFYIDKFGNKIKKLIDIVPIRSNFSDILVFFSDNTISIIPKTNLKKENLWFKCINDKNIYIKKSISLQDNVESIIIQDNLNNIKRIAIDSVKSNFKTDLKNIFIIKKGDNDLLFYDKNYNYLYLKTDEIPLLNNKEAKGVIFNSHMFDIDLLSFNSEETDSIILLMEDVNKTEGYISKYYIKDLVLGKRKNRPKQFYSKANIPILNKVCLNKNSSNIHFVDNGRIYTYNSSYVDKLHLIKKTKSIFIDVL